MVLVDKNMTAAEKYPLLTQALEERDWLISRSWSEDKMGWAMGGYPWYFSFRDRLYQMKRINKIEIEKVEINENEAIAMVRSLE